MTGNLYFIELLSNGTGKWIACAVENNFATNRPGDEQATPGAAVESALRAIDVFYRKPENEQKPATAT